LREPVSARCPGWPAGTFAARFHRCTKTPARPPLAPLSRCESRPRAPLRLLQVDVPTSTTTDHPNILIRGIRGRDDCHARFRKSPSFFGAAAGGAQGQGPGQTDARHSRSRLLAPETSPQPRSLRAPGVARRRLSPVWSDAVRCGAADAGRPSKERPPKGWHGAGHPRRCPPLSSPRCLPSQGRSRCERVDSR
jgi:hypothetical protein